MVVWCSLVPPLPALLVSWLVDPPSGILSAVLTASWRSLAAVLYLAIFGTVMAYRAWGFLLQRYPSGVVAPFALLAPCTGVISAASVFGELPGAARWAGMVLILAGLAVIVLLEGAAASGAADVHAVTGWGVAPLTARPRERERAGPGAGRREPR